MRGLREQLLCRLGTTTPKGACSRRMLASGTMSSSRVSTTVIPIPQAARVNPPGEISPPEIAGPTASPRLRKLPDAATIRPLPCGRREFTERLVGSCRLGVAGDERQEPAKSSRSHQAVIVPLRRAKMSTKLRSIPPTHTETPLDASGYLNLCPQGVSGSLNCPLLSYPIKKPEIYISAKHTLSRPVFFAA